MKKILLLALTMLIAIGCAVESQQPPNPTPATNEEIGQTSSALSSYTIIATDTQVKGTLLRTEFTVSASADPLDRFSFTRVSKILGSPKALVLLLPSRNCNAVEYEWTDVGVPYGQSMVGIMAHHDYEVWSFSPRTTSLIPPVCATPGACNVAQSWGMQTYVEDINFVRNVMRVFHPGEKPFVGGLSLGAMLTYATLDAHPNAYRGAFIWEGLLKFGDPSVANGFVPICNADQANLSSGVYTDDFFGSVSRLAYTLATTAPTAPSPLPFFPGFNNQQTFVGLFALPNPAVPIPGRGFVIDAGDPFVAQAFTYTNNYREGQQILTGNYYESVHLERDFDCSFAGIETSFTDNLAAYSNPVLAIKAGLGFGDYMDYNLSLLSSTDVTVMSNPAYGHADHLLSTTYKTDVVLPIISWMDAH